VASRLGHQVLEHDDAIAHQLHRLEAERERIVRQRQVVAEDVLPPRVGLGVIGREDEIDLPRRGELRLREVGVDGDGAHRRDELVGVGLVDALTRIEGVLSIEDAAATLGVGVDGDGPVGLLAAVDRRAQRHGGDRVAPVDEGERVAREPRQHRLRIAVTTVGRRLVLDDGAVEALHRPADDEDGA